MKPGPGFAGYSGCLVMQLTPDLKGVLRHPATHAPLVHEEIGPTSTAFNGACTAAWSPAADSPSVGGYLLPVLTPASPFHILPSFKAPTLVDLEV